MRGDLWGVITTIFSVNPAVVDFVGNMPLAKLVVVGDLKTNDEEWRHFAALNSEQVFYLEPDKQKGFQSIQHIPWNHFGRKSIGYLFAMQQNATVIYDFDDDNHLNVPNLNVFQTMSRYDIVTKHHVYNPYPFFSPEINGHKAFVWPRGQSLQWINDPLTYKAEIVPAESSFRQTAVVQSLANHDPDVDAIYRMTRRLPITFTKSNTIVIPPRGTFTPWNAQSVLIFKPAFFGMLLPITVTGRVSDIWRSYITTRLMWETEYVVGYSSPVVTQWRNPHSYQKDMEDEDDLYHKADLMLATLANWSSTEHATLDTAYLNLVAVLVKLGILKQADLLLASAWVADLKGIGYQWPAIVNRFARFTPRARGIVDNREKEPQRKTTTSGDRAINTTVVCLRGMPGASNTSAALKLHVLDTLNADLIKVSPADREETLVWFDRHVPNWNLSKKIGNYLGGLPGIYSTGALQLVDRVRCLDAIRAKEIARGVKYDRVVISRADLMWIGPHPNVTVNGNSCWIPCRGNDWGDNGVCDHFAFCGREGAEAYSRGPAEMLPRVSLGPKWNAEEHLKAALLKRGTLIKRGDAPFFRSCPIPPKLSDLPQKCLWMERLNMAGKKSGGQLTQFL